MRRAVVTGIGVLTPLGIGIHDFWLGLMNGVSGASTISRFDASDQKVRIACELPDFDRTALLPPSVVSRTDRFAQIAVAAAELAWREAGLEELSVDPERVGIVVGTTAGATESIEREHRKLLERGARAVNPLLPILAMDTSPAALIAIEKQISGPTFSLSSACATGAHVIGEAASLVERGALDLVVACAADAAITPLWIAAFSRIGALSERNDDPTSASRPFDARRDGFVFGEGGGAMIIERRELAERRGAEVLASILGYGATTDAYHLSQPRPDGAGAALAMRRALDDAGVSSRSVDYINAHGSSTQLNDKAETVAIRDVLGAHADKVVVSATKSQIGHLLGAAGIVEAAAAILAMRSGAVPPTINLEYPDPDCDLDYVPGEARSMKVDVALNNSFGLGGANACIAIGAP